MNIPKAKYRMQIISFDDLDLKSYQELKDYIKGHLDYNETVADWLRRVVGTDENKKKPKKNMDLIDEMFDCNVDIEWHATSSLATYIGKRIGHRTVISEADRYGFFTVESDWGDTELCCLCNEIDIPSLYRGNL